MDKNAKFNLMDYLNTCSYNTMDEDIARYLFENRDKLENRSMRDIAEGGYFSQATLSRFFKHNGITFEGFKYTLMLGTTFYDRHFAAIHAPHQNLSKEEILHSTTAEMKYAVEQIELLKMEDIMEVVQRLKKPKRILFLGSQLSANNIYGLQALLVHEGIHAYAPQSMEGQRNLLRVMENGDLIIVLSMKQRWFNAVFLTELLDDFMASKAEKELWTPVGSHIRQELFDHVFCFAEHPNDLVYTTLMTLVPVLVNLYISEE
ncbi:MAG: MurR/RpiR family transcriptional regulator [Solobacterium sp.]|nr:MurR/RpiR family transcriptional regulator [Solobacterium sp.]